MEWGTILSMLCIVLVQPTTGEIFSALATMKTALHTETELATMLRDYVAKEQSRLAEVIR